ncbi:RNA-binding protein [Pedobacter sp. HMF7647]|uniref:RNA-binding protein n=1 Tax=Hufsiella arboris TaxID=2695275 RepID=A0A7K1YCQ0_9SPHI|nr:VCBS repeat-containing protein [Hufsiella arboris]MXV51818.1 RNA-binding protein [Hufsiella arboris]
MKLLNSFFLLLAATILFSCKRPALFQQVSSSHSGIHFNNKITENDTINPLDIVNIYNGGGVGVGDFNNDGLQDLYFTGNVVSNRLYINKGDFKFEDITEKAGVGGMGRWGRGVSVIDINNDGLLDLYVCNTIYQDSTRRCNLLYINQGTDKQGIPRFKNMAKEYGLDINVQSTMAAFFDYDNDGRLDMYLTVNEANEHYYPNVFGSKDQNHVASLGRLYHNTWNSELNHPVFSDVSAKAGIKYEGFGHAATIVDINRDGWKDIYVSNDFLSSNLLYINNHDGTFTDRSKEYFKHTSFNAMGQDIVDINNDGLADVFELDMSPEDNYRKKMMLGANSYQSVQSFDLFGYQYQYVRNTLQLNQGPRVLENDTIGSPAFSEIGFLSGIAQTDWSWTPVITDFNNDGYRDIIVTNGFPKDITDHDFMTYRKNAFSVGSKQKVLDQIPSVKISNYAYMNKGDLTFDDKTKDWGLSVNDFSNGAVYADLNNDGAMDLIINNIDDEAMIYKNTSRDKNPAGSHYLQVKFKGSGDNLNGLGAWVDIFYDRNKHQVVENNPYRGYLSSNQNIAHFGLGNTGSLDSVVVRWPNGKKQVLTHVKADQLLTVNLSGANVLYSWNQPKTATHTLFKEVTKERNIKYNHTERDFVDFEIQKLMPHKLSDYNPALAVADIDGNGLDDVVIGGNSLLPAQAFLQQEDGKFKQRSLIVGNINAFQDYKDEGILLFDANGDNKADVYISRGGYKSASGDTTYQDKLYINDGRGNFKLSENALPVNHTSKLCVRGFDYNRDGKLDLFVSGRVDPWKYPKAVSSFIFRNDSKNGIAKFTDVTNEVAPALKNIGLVCDALFSDYDNDGWPDLILAGEWMPLTFLRNDHGVYKNLTQSSGIAGKIGWWNSIVAGDFRHTGRMDYIIGNVGQNTLYRASEQYPVYITAKDFDNIGSYNAIPSIFLPDLNGEKKEFPAIGREDMLKEMISMKKKFTNYKSYAIATMDEVVPAAQREGALRLSSNTSQSCYLRNEGNGKFTMIPLPNLAQISAINGMVVDDFDGDGNLDVVINGNDYGTEVGIGRYDALNGLMLKGDGKGDFIPQSILQSGLYIPGDGKALVKFQTASGNYLMAASQNRGALKMFELKRNVKMIKLLPNDASAVTICKNGAKEKQEFYYGASFLSQSARFMSVASSAKNVRITNNQGQTRMVSFN